MSAEYRKLYMTAKLSFLRIGLAIACYGVFIILLNKRLI